MKNLILVLGLLFCTSNLFAQQNDLKNDIIVTTDGQFLQVKVTKVAQDIITFSYPGESLVNEIKPDIIDKIVFASGRTQNFNSGSANTTVPNATAAGDSVAPQEEIVKKPGFVENTMAIVPLEFEKNGAYEKDLANFATDFMAEIVSKDAAKHGIEVLPVNEAIEKLINAGINYDQLRQSSPEQLRDILETEYILYVSISVTKKDTASVGETDYISGAQRSDNVEQLQKTINLKVHSADSKVVAYSLDFSEQVSLRKSEGKSKSTSASENTWRSSLEYLAGQLFSSDFFSSRL